MDSLLVLVSDCLFARELHSARHQLLLVLRSPVCLPKPQAREDWSVPTAQASGSCDSPASSAGPHEAPYCLGENDDTRHAPHAPRGRPRSSSFTPASAGPDREKTLAGRSSAASSLSSRLTGEQTVRLGRRSPARGRCSVRPREEESPLAGRVDSGSEKKRLDVGPQERHLVDEGGGVGEDDQTRRRYCPFNEGAGSLESSWGSERPGRLGFKGLAMRRELALRRRMNARRKQRCAELQKQVDLLRYDTSARRRQGYAADNSPMILLRRGRCFSSKRRLSSTTADWQSARGCQCCFICTSVVVGVTRRRGREDSGADAFSQHLSCFWTP